MEHQQQEEYESDYKANSLTQKTCFLCARIYFDTTNAAAMCNNLCVSGCLKGFDLIICYIASWLEKNVSKIC